LAITYDHIRAASFLAMRVIRLGDAWLNNRRYRFGASALLNDLLRQLETQRTGAYQAPWAFSEDSSGY
jgi:deoxyribose-phosphate aldolase